MLAQAKASPKVVRTCAEPENVVAQHTELPRTTSNKATMLHLAWPLRWAF
jgi:hypothetical protein